MTEQEILPLAARVHDDSIETRSYRQGHCISRNVPHRLL